jgi:hypothetical protein
MTRQQFRDVMAERRQWPRGSMDWEYLTRTARTYLAMLRGVPANEWSKW